MQALVEHHGRARTLSAARKVLSEARERLSSLNPPPTPHELAGACAVHLQEGARSSMRRVLNLTGTVIHTNLGRSVLPATAVDAVIEAMSHPVNLEFDLDEGRRGERDDHVEGLLTRLTGAEAAVAVNNNAAAVFLALNTLAQGREVPVSRGELVEIGGAFRVPDIMERSGARLVEVGTTNRTHRKDYEAAIGPHTAALMKVHASNYQITGFTAAVDEAELSQLAHERSLPLIADLGSGTLVDLRQFGLPHEPTPGEMLRHGVDLVTFSGDKLLGGPQAGIVVGRKDLVDRLRRSPLKRALRLDKMTLAALEAVLRLYEAPDRLTQDLPVLRLLTRPVESIRAQAHRLVQPLQSSLGPGYEVEVVELKSQVGSGSLPVELLPSAGVRIRSMGGNTSSATDVASAFRSLPVPVVGRIHDGAFLLDLRCLESEADLFAHLPQLKVEG